MMVNSLMKCIVFCFVTGSSKYSNLYWRYSKGQSGVTTSHVLRLQWLLCEMVQEEIYLEEERVSGWLRSGTGWTMIGRSEDGLLQEITWLQLKVDGDKRQEGRPSLWEALLSEASMQMATEGEDLLWHLMASVCVTLQHGPASSGTQRWRSSSFPFPNLSILSQKVRLLTIPTLWRLWTGQWLKHMAI